MGNPSKSLSADVNGLLAYRHWFEMDPRSTLLPTTVVCPLCGDDQLDVFQDPVLGGEWLNCRACGFAGDFIELVAKSQGIEVADAVWRLGACGLIRPKPTLEETESYLRDHVHYRARLNSLWQTASASLSQGASRTARQLMSQLGVARAAQSIYTVKHIQRFLGAVDHRKVEEAFSPDSYAMQFRNNHRGKSTRRRGSGPGERRIFEFTGWDDVLLIPFWDLPGRISGFLIIGRDGIERNGDWIFKRANYAGNRRKVQEAGWGMLDGIDEIRFPQTEFEPDVFVMCDARVALFLQGIWAVDRNAPLPILIACDEPHAKSWNLPPQHQNRNVIFWANDHRLLPQAIATDSRISRFSISEKEIERRLGHHGPLDWLRLMRQRSLPWRVDLRNELSTRPWQEIEKLLGSLGLQAWELREFIRGCDPALGDKLERCNPDRIGRNIVQCGRKRIRETEAGWDVLGCGEQICNMPLRVEAVLTRKSRTSFYRGFVKRGSDHIRFLVDCSEADRRGLFPCVADYLLDKHQILFSYSRRWAKYSLNVAILLQSPEVFVDADRVGYHRQSRSFLLPQFQVRVGGVVDTQYVTVGVNADTPAAKLLPPEFPAGFRVVPSELRTSTPESSIIWCLTAVILHNLYAAVFSREPLAIVLDGPDTITPARTAALALGCVERQLGRSNILDQLAAASRQHDWPVLAKFPDRGQIPVTTEWVDNQATRNAILPLPRYAALSLASYSGFARIHIPGPLRPFGSMVEAAAKIVPAFLQHACRQRLDHDLWNDGHSLYAWIRHLAAWLTEQSLDNRAVLGARRFLFVDSLAPWRVLVELTLHMYYQGDLQVCTDYRIATDLPLFVYHRESAVGRESVEIPIRGINQRLAVSGLPVLDLEALRRSLVEEGAWLAQDDAGPEQNWLIDLEWWDEKIRNIRALERYCEQIREDCSRANPLTGGAEISETAKPDG